MLMANYRRNKIAGGSYFFTATLRDRKLKMLVDHVFYICKLILLEKIIINLDVDDSIKATHAL